MNIVVAGKNNIAVNVTQYILDKYKNVTLYSVHNQNDNGIDGFQRSFKKYCSNNHINLVSLDEIYEIEDLLFLSLEFDKIIKPERFLSKHLFNIHFSKLPKYRGMYTSVFPILNGENESGVTLHLIEQGIDTGDIIDQFVFPLEENETAENLYKKYIENGTSLVIKNLDNLVKNNYLTHTQQINHASYYSRYALNFNDIKIDHNKCAFEIKKQYMSFTFRSYQLPKYQEKNIFGVKITKDKSNTKPGTLINSNDSGFKIATVDYDVILQIDKLDELLNACEHGDFDKISILIESNPLLINEKNEYGWSPIIVAAYNGHLELIKLLIKSGANINDVNYKGTSVLMYAKDYLELNGDPSVINWLIRHGANISHTDFTGKSVTDYVQISGNTHSHQFFICG